MAYNPNFHYGNPQPQEYPTNMPMGAYYHPSSTLPPPPHGTFLSGFVTRAEFEQYKGQQTPSSGFVSREEFERYKAEHDRQIAELHQKYDALEKRVEQLEKEKIEAKRLTKQS